MSFFFCLGCFFASLSNKLENLLIIYCFRAYSHSSDSALGRSSCIASVVQYHFCTASVEFEFKASYASDCIMSTPKYSTLDVYLDGERLVVSAVLVKQKYGGLAPIVVDSATLGRLLHIQSCWVSAAISHKSVSIRTSDIWFKCLGAVLSSYSQTLYKLNPLAVPTLSTGFQAMLFLWKIQPFVNKSLDKPSNHEITFPRSWSYRRHRRVAKEPLTS